VKAIQQSSFGVFKEAESDDVDVLVNNFTSPALARALRERETTLHNAAHLINIGNIAELTEILRPFLKSSVDKRRKENYEWDITKGLTRRELVLIQRQLHRIPREVFQSTSRRASVVIPLCNKNGVASILFERRSATVRTHKQEVCFPGGMVEEGIDATIIQTSLREMEEELGIPPEKAEVLGVLRCNWDEVANMTGISVTPVGKSYSWG
jgi:nudix motif 8